MASVFLLSQLMFLAPGIDATHPWSVTAGEMLMLAATAAAFVMRGPHVPLRVAMVIPLADILAVGFLRAGTADSSSAFTYLFTLAVVSLGVEPGRLPLLLGGPVTVAAMLLPLAIDDAPLDDGEWVRVIFVPLVLGLVCLSVNELTRRLRSRIRAVQQLRQEQEGLLVVSKENASAVASASALLQDSAHQLAGVIDAVTEQSIIATDRTGRIDVFNSGAQKMLKVAKHDAIGRSILQFHRPGELSVNGNPAAAPFAVLVAGVVDGTPRVRDWTYVGRDGVELRVQVTITARRDAARDVDGFLFVATDVTQDRENARLKDEFVNLISHELRTPLSSILGYLELAVDDEENPLSPEQLHYLGIIERNAHRLLHLVSDLLFTAQVESGRFHLQEQSVDLAALVSASLETASPAATERGVVLRLAVSDEQVIVWGDPVRLGQAVDNLISNAVKFTPNGGRVAVTVSTVDDPESRALVSVTDTGVGIPADELDRLFSRFFRASTATAHAVPGVGLGLTITKAIAAAHHGTIRVASTVGEGTTITLDLPLSADVPRADAVEWTV